jgi:hypothetical protein
MVRTAEVALAAASVVFGLLATRARGLAAVRGAERAAGQ